MKTFVRIIKRILNEKYPSVDFDFYLLSCAKNVHMGLYFNILTLHDQIISDIEETQLKKR